MVKHTVHLAVDLTIDEGKPDAFEGIAQAMVASSQKEPGTLGSVSYTHLRRSRRSGLFESWSDLTLSDWTLEKALERLLLRMAAHLRNQQQLPRRLPSCLLYTSRCV